MSDGATATVGDVVRVLVVGDSPRIDRTVDALAGAFDSGALVRARSVSEGLERLAETEVHCLVCEFRADPGAADRGDGPARLERLAARTDAPIVAVTDGASADRALEAGATDVVETDDSSAVVATRVRNAAQRWRLATEKSDLNRRARAILEGSDALVLTVDEDGAIAYASPAVESRLGYTPDELERTTLTQLVHPDDRDDARDLLAAVAAAPFGASERRTLRLGDGDGRWRLVELTCADRLAAPAIDGLVVTITAVGPAGRDDGVRAAIDRLPGPVFALGPDWELRYANPAARRFFDGEPRPGTVVWSLLPESIRDTFSSRLREAATTGSTVRFDAAVGERRLEVVAAPDDDGLTVLARDRKPPGTSALESPQGRQERDRLELLESTIDALEDGVAVLEGETIELANAALLELTDATTLVGREVDALFDDALAATVRERARSPIVRWMEPITGRLVAGGGERSESDASAAPSDADGLEAGDGRPVDVFVAPLPDDERERTLCVVRDRRRSGAAALSSVQDALADLARAETDADVRQAVVDGLRAATDAELAAWYLVDEDRLRPAAMTTRDGQPAVELPPIERDPPAFDDRDRDEPDAGSSGGTDPFAIDQPTVYDRSALEPALARSGIRAERVLAVPVDDRAVVLATSSEPMAFEALDLDAPAALADAASLALDRLSERARVRDCRRDRTRLESALARDERLRTCERDLLAAEAREAVEQRLCDGVLSLSSADGTDGDRDRDDGVELAWVGRTAAGRETLTASTWAGRDGEFLESASLPLEADADDPAVRTATRREPTVVDDLEAAVRDRENGADVHREALERGFRAALSVPIEHDEFQYGTLTAYATRSAAFDEDLRAACTHLASVAGHAIGALERKRALLSDSVAELEIVVRDESEPLSAIARGVGSRIDVRTVVPRTSGGSTVYCTIADADPAAIQTTLDGISAVESFREVGDNDDGDDENGGDDKTSRNRVPLEIRLSASTVAETLAEYGGVLRSIEPVDDRARLVIELASTVDVRAFVRTIERTHSGTELAARRERDRSVPPARPFDAELRDRLSERQLRTLEAAYYGGFFDWPRESTGEEVAETLGISQPTFSRHLRLAQHKLFELLFDERGEE
ncbi:bacterio-opsin activator domain-containing protein [Halopiger aswanensis]|uniref:PAS domain S-box-containing protein n=1 Tax=Halopiger aswanensis TaxID=148449 RepID=A0A3R7FXB6_9EURY|nr:bacterio-opsin activator domain-containing protein [Halopiger aswanensis]RKD97326.1 PAS domain S-box-containing protein [Halopiger aswanensis]